MSTSQNLVSLLAQQASLMRGYGVVSLSEKMAQAGVPATVIAQGGDAVGQLNYGGTAPMGTDYTPFIQSILLSGPATGMLLFWDGAWGISGRVSIPSNTWIMCPSGACGAILRNGSNCVMFQNSGSATSTGGDASLNAQNTWGAEIGGNPGYRQLGPFANTNIRITGGTWNGNNGPYTDLGASSFFAHNTGVINTGMSAFNGGTLSAFQFYGVQNLILEDFTTYSTAGYAITGCNWFKATLRNLTIDQSVTTTGQEPSLLDNLHINGPGANIRIENVRVHGYDDHVAILPDDAAAIVNWYPIAGDMSDIVVRDVTIIPGVLNDGDIRFIRLLSAGSNLSDLLISNIYGTTDRACIEISNNPAGGPTNNPGNGKFGNITFENVEINPQTTSCFLIDGTIVGILKIIGRKLDNIQSTPDVLIQNTGNAKTINQLVYNYSSMVFAGAGDRHGPKIQVAMPIAFLRVEAQDDLRDTSFTALSDSSVVHITAGGSVNVLSFSGHADRCGYVVGADSGTTLNTCIMTGLHSNANGGSPLNLGTLTVKNFIHTDMANVGAAHTGGTVTNDSTSSFASGNHYAD